MPSSQTPNKLSGPPSPLVPAPRALDAGRKFRNSRKLCSQSASLDHIIDLTNPLRDASKEKTLLFNVLGPS